MKSVVLLNGRPILQDVEVPVLSDGDVLIEMKRCGLCGTDLEKIGGHYTASQPILGHEPAGVVAESRSEIVNKGERVFAHHHVPCYKCYYCTHGSPTMCSDYRRTNIYPGGFSEFFRVPAFNVNGGGILTVPPSVSYAQATFIEPLATVLRAQRRASLKEGESVYIVGAGPMGQLHMMAAKSSGAGLVIMSDLAPARLDFALKMGADSAIQAGPGSETEVVRLTGGRGADLSIVATGSPKAVASALRSTRRGGRVLLFGVPFKGSIMEYDLSDLLNNELSIIPSNAAVEEDTKEALRFITSGRIDVSPLVSKEYSLDQFEEAVRDSMNGNVIKALIVGRE